MGVLLSSAVAGKLPSFPCLPFPAHQRHKTNMLSLETTGSHSLLDYLQRYRLGRPPPHTPASTLQRSLGLTKRRSRRRDPHRPLDAHLPPS
jgi:hypothetical protein